MTSKPAEGRTDQYGRLARVPWWSRLAFLAAVSSACGPQVEKGSDVRAQPEPLSMNMPSRWPIPANNLPVSIPVCWETAGFATEKGWVQNAVATTWSTVANVQFTGWGACTATSRGIRVQIIDAGPRVLALGRKLDGMQDGMHLNFTYVNWNSLVIPGASPSPTCLSAGPSTGPSYLERCIRGDAVHEFGHALGFAHEQNRPDNPSPNQADCQRQTYDVNFAGDVTLGTYDIDSIMNYCNTAYTSKVWPYTLSAGDGAGARALYGPPPGMAPAQPPKMWNAQLSVLLWEIVTSR